jgi:hypothetical protein
LLNFIIRGSIRFISRLNGELLKGYREYVTLGLVQVDEALSY